jgi:hypothetical protein
MSAKRMTRRTATRRTWFLEQQRMAVTVAAEAA